MHSCCRGKGIFYILSLHVVLVVTIIYMLKVLNISQTDSLRSGVPFKSPDLAPTMNINVSKIFTYQCQCLRNEEIIYRLIQEILSCVRALYFPSIKKE